MATLTLVSAEYGFDITNNFGFNNILMDEEATINYSLIPTVNSSYYWDDLRTPADISTGDLTDDGTYVEVTGDTMTGDLDIDNAGNNSEITIHSGAVNLNTSLIFEERELGRWRMLFNGLNNNFYLWNDFSHSPTWMANLNTNDMTFNGSLLPWTNLSYDIGSGALMWRNLFVSSISAHNITAYSGTFIGPAYYDEKLGYANARIGGDSWYLSGRLILEYFQPGLNTIWQIDNGGNGIRFFNDADVYASINESGIDTDFSLFVGENVIIEGNFSAKRAYIMVSSNVSQVATVADTVYTMNWSHIEDEYMMDLEGAENITFQDDGDYLIAISTIIVTDTNNKHFNVFPQIWNGTSWNNVPRSNTRLEIENAGTEGIIAVTFMIDIEAGEKFRLMYSSNDAGSMTVWTAGSGTGVNAIPETPSTIMTIMKHSEITE